MAEFVEKPVQQLIGDFYEAHANGDADGMQIPLGKLQNMIFTGELDSEPFIEYYNNIFSGRTAYNAMISVNDYPFESIFRELLQNTFDCFYPTKDVKIMVNFKDNDEISLSYNEIGFTMEQFLYYLAFGRNSGDRSKEGRFGVGAKSVFMNVQWLSMRSNNFSFKIENTNGTLKITQLNLLGSLFKGTEITVKVSGEQYARIKDNFLSMTDKKGDFINLVELCFAFNRKKVMNSLELNMEEPDRTFNIAIMEKGKIVTLYKIAFYQKEGEEMRTIRFLQNNKSVADFICHEQDGFVYLIPFAVATAKRASIVKVFLQKYNFFSTYELTGLIKADAKEKIIDEKLSAFFISVSNDNITMFRTGIKSESEANVMKKVESGLLNLIETYNAYFVLDLQPLPEMPERYFMRPKSYAFEFIKNFILTSRLAKNIKNSFQENISLHFPNEPTPVPYTELRKTAFAVSKSGVTEEAHKTGEAYKALIDVEREKALENLTQFAVKTLYLAYEWENVTSSAGASGRQFYYEFIREGGSYIIESKVKPNLSDYNLYVKFQSLVGLGLDKFIDKNNRVSDEVALEGMFAFFDDSYNEDYKVHMRYSQLYISHLDEEHIADISKIKVGNIKNAMDTIQNRRQRFDTQQIFNEIVKIFIKVFTQSKDTIEFLKEIKEQGGQVTLALDINKKYRFSAYGQQFLIPGKTTVPQMIDIIGDMALLISAGMLNGRKFDFAFSRGRYSFDKKYVYNLLKSDTVALESVSGVLSKLYTADMGVDKIALLGTDDKIIEITDIGKALTDKQKSDTKKFIILRDDFTKAETAEMIEVIITGENNNILARSFVHATEPNIVIADQIPYYQRPLPTISGEEFAYLRETVKNIGELKGQKAYKNYFAKDVNAKLFGYGGYCPICGIETEIINSFTVKEFETEVIENGKERSLTLTFYMCANDACTSGGWIIENVTVGGMTPFMWIEKAVEAETLPPEFLYCTVRVSSQITHDIPSKDKDKAGDNVIAAPAETFELILTPLMAAKWVEDNINKPIEAEQDEPDETPVETAAIKNQEVFSKEITF